MIAVGPFGALVVEGGTLAQGTQLDFTTIYTPSLIDLEQIMKVTNSALASGIRGCRFWVPSEFWTSHNEAFERTTKRLDGQLDVAN